jgi:hypothetical protein
MTQIYNPDGGIESVVEDPTPQLGGNLDLNNNDITGTGNINITGSGTLTGDLTVDTNTLYVDSTNNQVGIGTTTLGEALTVNGNVEADNFIGGLRGEVQFKAKAGEAITKGDPVYISGFDVTGNTPVVGIADANDFNKIPAFGLAENTASLNASIDVVTFGTLSGLNTSSFSLGDVLYVSDTGTLTNTRPKTESSLIQNIGKVQRVHPTAGSIKVGGAGRTNDVPNLNEGNVFIGDATNCAITRGLTLDDISETATNKHFTASDNTKLDGIESGAEVNVNADWNAVSGDAQILNKPSDVTDLSTHNVTELADVTSAGSGAIITSSERSKLSGIASGAEVNVQSDWTATSGDAFILNKPFQTLSNSGLIPTMTSNTSGGYTASASSQFSTTYYAYKAFDNNSSTRWATLYLGTWDPFWVKIQLPSAKRVWKASLVPYSGYYPTSYTIEGSNDDSTWDVLGQSGFVDGVLITSEIPLITHKSYLYYRMFGRHKYGSYGGLVALQIYEAT